MRSPRSRRAARRATRVAGTDMLYSSRHDRPPEGRHPRRSTPTPLETTPDACGTAAAAAVRRHQRQRLPLAGAASTTPLRCASRWRTQALGATVVAMEHFDAEQYLALIERYHVTVTPGRADDVRPPAEADPRCARKYDVSSLRCVIHAAAPCPVPVKKQMIEWFGPVLHEYYAGTEGNGFVYCNSEMWLAHEGTVGTPINCVVHICDDDGESCHAARRAPSTSRAAPRSSTTTTPRRRRRRATRRGGARSAMSAISTTTTSCTSPIARRS